MAQQNAEHAVIVEAQQVALTAFCIGKAGLAQMLSQLCGCQRAGDPGNDRVAVVTMEVVEQPVEDMASGQSGGNQMGAQCFDVFKVGVEEYGM
ncbi:hypothetical protein D3C80_1912600 [compost metagenome]